MALPAAASATGPHHHNHFAVWEENLDDAALTGNEGGEADLTRVIVTDEESLLEAEDATTSYGEELLETAKLLLSGGVAGAFSKTTTAPLARLTILQQVDKIHCPCTLLF